MPESKTMGNTTSPSTKSSYDNALEKSRWLTIYDSKCCCFVLVSCLGYLTRKMYEQTDESLSWKQARIRRTASTKGPGKCTSTETLDKNKTLTFVFG